MVTLADVAGGKNDGVIIQRHAGITLMWRRRIERRRREILQLNFRVTAQYLQGKGRSLTLYIIQYI